MKPHNTLLASLLLVFSFNATATTVTVDGIKTIGEYEGGVDNGVKSLLWFNDHHSIYDTAAGNTNNMYWEINNTDNLFSLNVFFEVPTYARRMIWAKDCKYTGTGSDADCNAIPDAILDSYLAGAQDADPLNLDKHGNPKYHHDDVNMSYSTQTGSEYFKLNGGDTGEIKWLTADDKRSNDDNLTWATSLEYLLTNGICDDENCSEFGRSASIELMWADFGTEQDAFNKMNGITSMQLHLSDEARGLDRVIPPNPVPAPAAIWLLISGLVGMALIGRRKI